MATSTRSRLSKYDRLSEEEATELAAAVEEFGQVEAFGQVRRMLVFDRCSDEIHGVRLAGLVEHLDGALVDGVLLLRREVAALEHQHMKDAAKGAG